MFEYYYGNQTEQFNFVRVPWILFTHPMFANMSNDAKVLYALLLDRMSLSRQNKWFDDENRVYIIYTVEEAAATLNCCSEKASKLFRELDDVHGIGLITRKRRGLGKPSIIYVKNFIVDESFDKDISEETSESQALDNQNSSHEGFRNQDSGITEIQNTEIPVSCDEKNRIPDPDKTDAIKNNIINTDIINTDYQSYQSINGCEREDATALINENISYDVITQSNSSIADMITEIRNIMVDVICGERQVVISGKAVPAETAKSVFMKLTEEHILYVIDNISKLEGKIQCPDKYICTALYNAAYTCNISLFTGFTAHTGMSLTAGA